MRNCDRADADRAGVFESLEQIGRIAGRRYADQESPLLPRARSCRTNIFIAKIVTDCREYRHVVGQAECPKWFVVFVGADRQVIGKMTGCCRAATIADEENRRRSLARVEQRADESPISAGSMRRNTACRYSRYPRANSTGSDVYMRSMLFINVWILDVIGLTPGTVSVIDFEHQLHGAQSVIGVPLSTGCRDYAARKCRYFIIPGGIRL